MAGDARDGLIRVVYLERISALMMAAGAVLSEAVLLALVGTAHRGETLMVGSTAIVFVSVVLLPMSLRLPARLRRIYDDAAPIESVAEPRDGQDAVRRLSLRRTAGFVGVMACWLLFIGLASHQVMPPIMLVTLALVQWARSRATAGWERANGAVLWQGVPGLRGPRGRVFRVPNVAAGPVA
ncbi:hypothetical protein [Streptomyces mirabilis]|uniref:Uncharacterized protein n=1 Tax=Streptomyces mirabilis TaxID=68239 RepID=A0A1I2U2X9_9ACTN|nr:hypothetical protein [Streptomyces mirabilis]SFG68941.1 hypothetical protein SAMN02787118_12628 [Streptomyces mirabilis]